MKEEQSQVGQLEGLERGANLEEVLDFFDACPPVQVADMIGCWRGDGLATGHPMDGMLEATGWHGKRFDSAEAGYPLVYGSGSELFSVNPALLPMRAGSRLRPLVRHDWANALSRRVLRLAQTSKPTARLRMMEYRGVVTATMSYDALPINDHFRRVDDDTVIGAMDLRDGGQPFFFTLRREPCPDRTVGRRWGSRAESALVTGAASGIGARAVQRLRARGMRVLATDLSPAVIEMYADDPDVHAVAGDIAAEGFAATLVADAERLYGGVDLLLHCAGIMPGGLVRDKAADVALRTMNVNYAGTVRAVEAVLPQMRQRGCGQIVVLGSLTGYVPSAGFAGYSASKSAVNTFIETLAHEEAGSGVQVLLAAPTAVKTPLLNQATGGPAFVEKLSHQTSSPLMITTDDVLDAVDRGIAHHKIVVTPGGRAAYLLRRLSPKLTWWLADRIG